MPRRYEAGVTGVGGLQWRQLGPRHVADECLAAKKDEEGRRS